MNLRLLTDEVLVLGLEKLVGQEREILTEILHHLREIERRRLFSSLGYKSLFDYAVKKLGYSEDQAYRRISAMKLLRDLPEVEEKITSGVLNLTHLSLAQSLFKKESLEGKKISKDEKIDLLEKLENKSSREAQKIVLSLAPNPQSFIPERSRQITEDLTEMRIIVSESLKHKIEKLKGLYAHCNPNMTTAELLEKLCDNALKGMTDKKKHKDVKLQLEEKVSKNNQTDISATSKKSCVKKNDKQVRNVGGNEVKPKSYMQIRREVWQRANHRCENCQSTYALEIDHILPKSKGGPNTEENLRLLCRHCNQRAAIQQLGQKKMDLFIN